MRIALVLLVPLLAGCPNTDPAVFVEAQINGPSVAVTQSSLVTTVSGGFSLGLHLSARASGPSTVKLASFSIVDGQNQSIVDPLKVSASPMPPVTVPQGGDATVALTIDSTANMLPKETANTLCAGDITIAGVIDDSLEDTGTPVASAPFKATGCP